MKKSIRIGTGAGYSGDRIEPAVELAKKGTLDYLVFECLAERTIALAQLQKAKNPHLGYDPLLEERMNACLAICHKKGIKIISNMGAANPLGAAKKTIEIAKGLGISGLKVAAVTGDDVLEIVQNGEHIFIEGGDKVEAVGNALISANAYLGVEGILAALQIDADVILTGRVADPSLFLAPLIYEFNWSLQDLNMLGKGTALGHLLECAAQVTGGYFADGVKKQVSNFADLGFPIAEISSDGSFFITKLKDAGGMVTKATCTEQLLYEVHDPSNYLTPDVIADFSEISFTEVQKDCIHVQGAKGKTPTDKLKVSVGYRDGFIVDSQISYGGSFAKERAELAIEVLKERIALRKLDLDDIQFDLIGLNGLFNSPSTANIDITELRLRLAAKTKERGMAEKLANEVEALYTNGPAAGGGVSKSIQEVIAIQSVLIDKGNVKPQVKLFSS